MVLLMMEAVRRKLLVPHSPRRTLRRAMGTTTILPALRWVITRNGLGREATATALRQRENTSELPMMVRMRLCEQLRVNRLLCPHQPPRPPTAAAPIHRAATSPTTPRLLLSVTMRQRREETPRLLAANIMDPPLIASITTDLLHDLKLALAGHWWSVVLFYLLPCATKHFKHAL